MAKRGIIMDKHIHTNVHTDVSAISQVQLGWPVSWLIFRLSFCKTDASYKFSEYSKIFHTFLNTIPLLASGCGESCRCGQQMGGAMACWHLPEKPTGLSWAQ